MDRFEVDLHEWKDMDKRQSDNLKNWEKEMKRSGFLKRCRCGNAYTWQHLGRDPRACPSCRGDEGDLIL